MSSLEDLERRVSVLEQRAHASEADMVGVQAHLHALTGSQEVILDTLRDHGRLLAAHEGRLNRIEEKLVEHDARFDQVDARFDQVDARFDGVDARFDRVEGKLDLVVDWVQAQA